MCSLLLRLWLPCKHFWNLAAQMVRWWSAARLYIDYLTCCISLHITRLLKVHFILHCGSGSSFFFPLTFYHNHFMDMFLFYKPLYNPMETFLQNITLTVSRFVHLAANTFHFEMGKLKLQSIVKLNYLRSNFCFITGSQIIIIQVASFSFQSFLVQQIQKKKPKHCEAHESFSSTQSHTSEIHLRHSVCSGFTEYFNSLSLAVSVAFLIHSFGLNENYIIVFWHV